MHIMHIVHTPTPRQITSCASFYSPFSPSFALFALFAFKNTSNARHFNHVNQPPAKSSAISIISIPPLQTLRHFNLSRTKIFISRTPLPPHSSLPSLRSTRNLPRSHFRHFFFHRFPSDRRSTNPTSGAELRQKGALTFRKSRPSYPLRFRRGTCASPRPLRFYWER